MNRDLRKLMQNNMDLSKATLLDGHEDRFLAKLDEKLPIKRPKPKHIVSTWWAMAASIALIACSAVAYFQISSSQKVDVATNSEQTSSKRHITLGDLSPQLRQMQDSYLTMINIELAKLDVSDKNQELVDSYLKQLAELDDDYNELNKELNELGPNNETINALIYNLQLRLRLLLELRDELNYLKSTYHEQV